MSGINDKKENEYLNWIVSVKEKLGMQRETLPKFVIYTVPRSASKIDKDPYSPHTVSIGPLHRGKDEFMIGEEHKWRYASHFFYRTDSPVQAVEECASAIRQIASEARESYAATLNFTEIELIEIFLLDGCFMLELFIRYSTALELKNDPLLQNRRLFQDIQQDLAILENQIPFMILLALFDSIHKFLNDQAPLLRYALNFFSSVINLSKRATDETCILLTDMKIEHILDMLHLVYRSSYRVYDSDEPERTNDSTYIISDDEERVIAKSQATRGTSQSSSYVEAENVQKQGLELSAIGLKRYGIRFEKGDKDMLLSLKFVNGTITIPSLEIDRRTNTIFRNLIAFEQFRSGSSYFMSSYAIVMSSLIKSSNDVKLLQQNGIIKHNGDAEDIVVLFEGLSMEANAGPFQYSKFCDEVNYYYMVTVPASRRSSIQLNEFYDKSIATLKNEYFKNVWTSLSVIAAIILLVLTALQTIYTLVAYYHRS